MAKYQANPIVVDAQMIVGVGQHDNDGNLSLLIADELSDAAPVQDFTATPNMISRYTPVVGDYVVTQDDGYVYLNPKAVFERKYAPVAA